jgi:hypothetical protein
MKKLLILLFSILISFNSYGEWERILTSSDGDTFYLDRDLIKKHEGFVYYWEMNDYLMPSKHGIMSGKLYKQGDCGVNREKHLSFVFYEQPMGEGSGKTMTPPDEWVYPTPESISHFTLDFVCNYAD